MHSTEQLISPDFNDESYLRGVLHLSVEKWAKTEELRLAAAMEEVKKRTQVILAEHADDMVAHVEAIHAAQADATATRQLSASLSKASTRLGSMIEEPYLLVKSKVAELEHTTQAAEVLQAVLRFLSCFRRLEALSSSEDGLLSIRTAKALQEAQTLLHHDALRGVEVVESRAPLVERIARGVREAIHERLAVLDGTAAPTTTAAGEAAPVRTGTRTSEAITTALQCASILGTLPQVLQEFMRQQKQVVLRCLVVELDGQGIAEAMMRNKERPDAANPLLLQRIQHVLVVVLEHTQRVIQLWRQLLRQHLHLKLSTGRTNNNNNTSISGSGAHSSIALPLTASVVPTLADFWSAISEKLKERLLGMQGRTELMSVLTQHYPRYIFLLQSFLSTNEGGAAALVSDAAAVSKFGMSDYLELIQLVEAAVQERTVGPSTPRQNHTTEAIKRGWLQQVSGHLRTRFIATIMDRYREQLSPVFAALQEISPANISAANQPMPWRPTSSHSHAALNATNFLRFASGDAHHYRQDPHTLQLIVDAMLQCATQLRDRVAESARRAPLPPLPSVAGGITRGQYLNICIANMCSSLLLELAGILALLPDDQAEDPSSLSQQQHVLRHGDEGQEEADPWTEAVQALRQQRRALREVMQSLSTLAEASTTPFLSSATAMAMPLIASCISSAITTTTNNNNNNSSAATPAQLQQLHALMEHFTTHWHVLVDAHVAGWMDGTRQTVDGLIAHTLVRCVLLHPVSATVDRVTTVKILTRTLSDTPIIMLRMLSGNNNNHNNFNSTNTSSVCLSRSTLLLKAAAKQMEAVFTRAAAAAEPHTTTTTTTTTNNNTAEMLQRELSGAIKALHPLLSRLLLLQLMRLDRHLPPTCGDVAGPEVAAHLTSEAFVEKVVEELLRVAHAATVANTTYNTNNNATSAESELQRLITAVDECYAEMMRCAATSPAAELYRRGWAEVVARGAAV